MWGGLSAPLVIEDEVAALDAFDEKVLVLKDLALVGSDPAPHDIAAWTTCTGSRARS